jgi:hypothetical protein
LAPKHSVWRCGAGALFVVVILQLWATPAAATTILKITGARLSFYSDYYALKADGDVSIALNASTHVTGQTLYLDLRQNRMIVAGAVRLSVQGVTQPGAALAVDFDQQRAYFIAFAPEPQVKTYDGLDLSKASSSAAQPAGVFEARDLSESVPVILAKKVTIGLRSYLRFGSCRVAPIGGVAAYVPLPSLYINFAKNPNLAQTTLGAATAAAAIKLTGSANAASALALSYASTTKFGVGFQQNAVWEKGWGVLSIFPINQSSPFFSAIVSQAPSQSFGLQASTLLNSYPSGGSLPASKAQFNYVQMTQSLHDAYLQLNYQFGSSDLLATPPIQGAYGLSPRYGPTHPSSVQVGLNSSTLGIGHLLDLNARGGYVYNHNGDGLQQFGGVNYTSIWSPYAGLTLSTPRIGLRAEGIGAAPYLVLQATGQRQWNSLPHSIDQANTNATLTQPISIGSVIASYTISNVKDDYGAAQRQAYPVIAPVQDPGYAAFQGFATFRTLSLALVYAVNPYFALSVAGQQHTDFPAPSPALFTPVQPTVLGVNPLPDYLGQPPYDLPITARIRVNGSLSINVQSTYYFNYFGNTWNGVQVQFLP